MLAMHPADEERKRQNTQAEKHDTCGLLDFVYVGADDPAAMVSRCRDRNSVTYAKKYDISVIKAEASSAPTPSTFVLMSRMAVFNVPRAFDAGNAQAPTTDSSRLMHR